MYEITVTHDKNKKDDWTKSHFISARGATELMQSEESYFLLLVIVSSHAIHHVTFMAAAKMLTVSSSHFHFCHYNKRTLVKQLLVRGKSWRSWRASPKVVFTFRSKSDASCHCAHCHNNTIKISYTTCWGGLNFRQKRACWVPQGHTYRWLWNL